MPRQYDRAKAPARRPGEVFRETFLVFYSRRGDAAALRRLGGFLADLRTSELYRWPDAGEDVPGLLRATVKDLRYLQRFLDSGLDEFPGSRGGSAQMEHNALMLLAESMGAQVGELADRLDAALADPKATLEAMRAEDRARGLP